MNHLSQVMGWPIPEWFEPTQTRKVMDASCGDLRPSEVVRLTTPDHADQAPLVARAATPPPPPMSPREMMERGDDTASAACTSILYRVCYDHPQ